MLPIFRVFLVAGAGLLVGAAAVRGQGPGPIAKDQLANILGAVNAMGRALDNFQDTLLENPDPGQPRGLYRQADGIQFDLASLRNLLQESAPRADLVFQYGKVEKKVHGLLAEIDGLGPAMQPIRQAAKPLRDADDELHFAVSGGDTGASALAKTLKRQGASLLTATKALQRNAAFSAPDKANLATNLKALTQATADFGKATADKGALEGMKVAFGKVVTAWNPVARDVNKLPAREVLHLMRSAIRVDDIQGRLFRLLGMKGERTRVSLGF